MIWFLICERRALDEMLSGVPSISGIQWNTTLTALDAQNVVGLGSIREMNGQWIQGFSSEHHTLLTVAIMGPDFHLENSAQLGFIV